VNGTNRWGSQGDHERPVTPGPPRVSPLDQPRAIPLKNITTQILVLDEVAVMVFDLAQAVLRGELASFSAPQRLHNIASGTGVDGAG
jgi:hypothetical protein